MKLFMSSVFINGQEICKVPYFAFPENESKLLDRILLEEKDVTIGEQILSVMQTKLGKKCFRQKVVILEEMSIERYVSTYPDMVLCAFFKQIIFYYLTDSQKFSYLKENFDAFGGVNLLIKNLTEKVNKDVSLKDKIDWHCVVMPE